MGGSGGLGLGGSGLGLGGSGVGGLGGGGGLGLEGNGGLGLGGGGELGLGRGRGLGLGGGRGLGLGGGGLGLFKTMKKSRASLWSQLGSFRPPMAICKLALVATTVKLPKQNPFVDGMLT